MFVVNTFNNFNRKMEEQMKQQQQRYNQSQYPEGHVRVEQEGKKSKSNHDGEYTDFEELK
jgi:hypothetical protein